MVNPSRCSCVRSLQSKFRSNNPEKKKKKSSSALVEVVTSRKDSSNRQVSAHLSCADQTRTIQEGKYALRANQATPLIHSMVEIPRTVERAKSHETCQEVKACSVSLEVAAGVELEDRDLGRLTNKRVNQE